MTEKIIVALDVDELSQAENILNEVSDFSVILKIGNQLGTFEGWQKAVQFANDNRCRIFCDTKFKDIPATVGRSARAITRHQPDFFTVMADNSPAALEAAVKGVESAMKDFNLPKRPKILGVTVLTSISEQESMAIYGSKPAEKVLQFANAAAEAGFDGIVCSPEEIGLLRKNPATKNLILMTPGIRPAWASAGDQARNMTPAQAIKNGADYLVIGRPITQPPESIGSPKDALQNIIDELENE